MYGVNVSGVLRDYPPYIHNMYDKVGDARLVRYTRGYGVLKDTGHPNTILGSLYIAHLPSITSSYLV